MGRNRVIILVAGILAVSMTAGFVAPLPVQAAKCPPNAYTSNCRACKHVPRAGHFSIHVPGTKVSLKGTGSAKTARTTICLTRVPAPRPSLGGVGVRVRATGKFNPLRLSKGKLYWFKPSTNKTVRVSAVNGPGIYQVVVR